jgi:hypothetical protein
MRELYALSGKKYLALLLSYQLIFLTSLLVGTISLLHNLNYGYQLSIFFKSIVLTLACSSLALLIDGLWEALSGAIFRLNYVKAKILHHWFFRPILLISILSVAFIIIFFTKLISVSLPLVYLSVSILTAAVILNFIVLFFVIKDIHLSKKLYRSAYDVIQSMIKKFERGSINRALLTLNLMEGEEKANPLPSQRGFIFTGLTSVPWHRNSDFSWVEAFEENYKAIKEEALKLMGNQETIKPYYYPGIVKGRWDSIILIRGGKQDAICTYCPNTMNLLRLISSRLQFREVMFSILRPGTKIKPHRDYANVFLTYHLGLVIPSHCGIRVGGEKRLWQEGKSLIFDTSYEHEAWNNSDDFRLILLIDFYHPELSEIEQSFLREFFTLE